MAHEIEMTAEGKALMAYAGETPWHGLGVKVSNDLTPSEMLAAAGLDWSVDKVPMMYGENNQVAPGHEALVRSTDGKLLDVVGADWNPVQNATAFEFFHEFVAAGDMQMNTAGSLKGGRNVWALAKVKESFNVIGRKDRVESYLLFSNPHQYGRSIDVRFTPIRVVCSNTLAMSLGDKAKSQVKLNHRTVFDPEMVKETLGIAHAKFTQYKETAQFLASKRFADDTLVEFFNRVFPHTYNKGKNTATVTRENLTRNAKTALEAIDMQPGADLGAGSWWAAANAVTFMTDHIMGRTADARLEAAWFGPNQTRKVEAMRLAVEYAQAA